MPRPGVGADDTGEADTKDKGPADDEATDIPDDGRGDAALLTGDGGEEQFTAELLYW